MVVFAVFWIVFAWCIFNQMKQTGGYHVDKKSKK